MRDSDTVYWRTLCSGTYKDGGIEETGALFTTWSDQLQPLRKFALNHPHISESTPFLVALSYIYEGQLAGLWCLLAVYSLFAAPSPRKDSEWVALSPSK